MVYFANVVRLSQINTRADTAFRVRGVKLLVDIESGVFKRLSHINLIFGVGGGTARAASPYGVRAVVAEKRYVAVFLCKGKRAVVFKHNGAFFNFLNAEIVRVFNQFAQAIFRKVAVFIAVIAALERKSAARKPEETVDVAGKVIGENSNDDKQRKKKRCNAGQAKPKFATFHNVIFLLKIAGVFPRVFMVKK